MATARHGLRTRSRSAFSPLRRADRGRIESACERARGKYRPPSRVRLCLKPPRLSTSSFTQLLFCLVEWRQTVHQFHLTYARARHAASELDEVGVRSAERGNSQIVMGAEQTTPPRWRGTPRHWRAAWRHPSPPSPTRRVRSAPTSASRWRHRRPRRARRRWHWCRRRRW